MSQEEVKFKEPTGYVICPVCQATVKSRGRYGHFKTRHPDLNYKEYKDKFVPAQPPEGKEPMREAPLYKGELDATAILRKILGGHPDIPKRAVDEICSWAEYGPIHPTQLVYLLSSMRGISTTTANIVAQKYSLALQKAQSEGKAQIPPALYTPTPQTQVGFPMAMPMYQQPRPPIPQQPFQQLSIPPQPPTTPPSPFTPQYPWYWAQPQQPPQKPPITEKDVQNTIREELEKMEERLKPKEKEEPYVWIEEPVRTPDGKVILGENDKPIVKKMRIPASQASLFATRGEDPEERVLKKFKLYKDIAKPEITEGTIRNIIRQEMPKPEEKPPMAQITPEDVKKAAAEAASGAVKSYINVHETAEKEDERFKKLEQAIRESGSAKTVEGYKQDSYRILGQGLSEGASAARDLFQDRRPITVFVREGLPLLTGVPPTKKLEKGAETGLLEKLEEKGWVVEQ